MGRLEEAQNLLAQLEAEMTTVADSARVDSLRSEIEDIQRMLYITEIR